MGGKAKIYHYQSDQARGRKTWCVRTKHRARMFATRDEAEAHVRQLERQYELTEAEASVLDASGITITELLDLALWLKIEGVQWGKVRDYITRGRGGNRPANSTTNPDLRTLHTLHCEHSHDIKPITLTTRRGIISRFLRSAPELDNIPARIITKSHILTALDRIYPHQPKAYNKALKELKTLLTWGERHDYLSSNVAKLLKKRKETETEILALTPDDIRTLITACRQPTPAERARVSELYQKLDKKAPAYAHIEGDHHDYNMLMTSTHDMLYPLLLMTFAGIRPYEISRLSWQDINLEDHTITIPARAAKTGGTRHITIRENLHKWLTLSPHLHTDTPIAPRGMPKKWRALRYRAGYHSHGDRWQADCLRHTFASMALKHGTPLADLQLDMGHHDLNLLRTRYLNLRGITRATAADFWSIEPEKT